MNVLQPQPDATPQTLRDQIDAYIAAGLHQRIPASHSALRPTRHRLDWDSLTPHASASAIYSASRSTRDRQPSAHENWPPLTKIIATVGDCPSKPGSSRAKRFELLRVGVTLKQLRDEGLRLSDLTRYLGAGVVTLSEPENTSPTPPVTNPCAEQTLLRPQPEQDNDPQSALLEPQKMEVDG